MAQMECQASREKEVGRLYCIVDDLCHVTSLQNIVFILHVSTSYARSLMQLSNSPHQLTVETLGLLE